MVHIRRFRSARAAVRHARNALGAEGGILIVHQRWCTADADAMLVETCASCTPLVFGPDMPSVTEIIQRHRRAEAH